MVDEHITHNAEGTPLRQSREEEKLEDLGIHSKQTPREAQRRVRSDLDDGTSRTDDEPSIKQRTEQGYKETSVDDIPLSDKAGEGRISRSESEERG